MVDLMRSIPRLDNVGVTLAGQCGRLIFFYPALKRNIKEALKMNYKEALVKLGNDLAAARKRRRIPVAVMSEKLSISYPTLKKIERGDPGVAIGTYALALEVFEMTDQLADLASAKYDDKGLALETERLPKRIGSERG